MKIPAYIFSVILLVAGILIAAANGGVNKMNPAWGADGAHHLVSKMTAIFWIVAAIFSAGCFVVGGNSSAGRKPLIIPGILAALGALIPLLGMLFR